MLPALLLPLFAFAATAVASPLKRDIYTIHDYVSVGHEGKCLKDSVHERILSKDYYGDHEHMTHESCAEFCSSGYSRGHNTFGVEYGQECFCGDKHDVEHVPTSYDCNMECKGNHAQNCGGHSAILVFHTEKPLPKPRPVRGTPVPYYPDWQYQDQCNADNQGHPLLKHQFASSSMSWGKCVARCESLKFNLAGIDAENDKNSCYCGDAHQFNSRHPAGSDQCKDECPNTWPLQICGGHKALSILYRGGRH